MHASEQLRRRRHGLACLAKVPANALPPLPSEYDANAMPCSPCWQVAVACTEEVLAVMDRGARNRAVAETKMNDRSSRSHQVGQGNAFPGRRAALAASLAACLVVCLLPPSPWSPPLAI